MELNRKPNWSGEVTFKIKYIDPKVKIWMLELQKKSIKDSLKHFQRNYIVYDPYSENEFTNIKKEMTSNIKKIKSLSRKIRKVKTNLNVQQ